MINDHLSMKRRPFLTPIWLLAIAALIALIIVGVLAWVWGTANSTTVVVIRHAEKELGSIVDPPLSEAGSARAVLLARMFGDAGAPGRVSAIYVSPTLASRLTAAPLAARLGLTPVVVSARDPRELARRVLREHPGGRVILVGHADTVPEIVAALSDEKDIPPLADREYGVMYIVSVPRIGHANLVRLNY
jgi:broad specificity phosphatase PhoE